MNPQYETSPKTKHDPFFIPIEHWTDRDYILSYIRRIVQLSGALAKTQGDSRELSQHNHSDKPSVPGDISDHIYCVMSTFNENNSQERCRFTTEVGRLIKGIRSPDMKSWSEMTKEQAIEIAGSFNSSMKNLPEQYLFSKRDHGTAYLDCMDLYKSCADAEGLGSVLSSLEERPQMNNTTVLKNTINLLVRLDRRSVRIVSRPDVTKTKQSVTFKLAERTCDIEVDDKFIKDVIEWNYKSSKRGYDSGAHGFQCELLKFASIFLIDEKDLMKKVVQNNIYDFVCIGGLLKDDNDILKLVIDSASINDEKFISSILYHVNDPRRIGKLFSDKQPPAKIIKKFSSDKNFLDWLINTHPGASIPQSNDASIVDFLQKRGIRIGSGNVDNEKLIASIEKSPLDISGLDFSKGGGKDLFIRGLRALESSGIGRAPESKDSRNIGPIVMLVYDKLSDNVRMDADVIGAVVRALPREVAKFWELYHNIDMMIRVVSLVPDCGEYMPSDPAHQIFLKNQKIFDVKHLPSFFRSDIAIMETIVESNQGAAIYISDPRLLLNDTIFGALLRHDKEEDLFLLGYRLSVQLLAKTDPEQLTYSNGSQKTKAENCTENDIQCMEKLTQLGHFVQWGDFLRLHDKVETRMMERYGLLKRMAKEEYQSLVSRRSHFLQK